ncbi:MAG: DUF1294 domain-containing protein [Ruminiclostridium sp.]
MGAKTIEIMLILYLSWNVITFAIMGLDKFKAVTNRWRISEHHLLTVAFFMGALGVLLGMKIFRHKTKHLKFMVGVPVCLIINLILLYGVYKSLV